MEKQYIIPIFIPNTDNQDSYMFGYKDNITRDKAKKIIDNHLKNLDKENAKIEIDFLRLEILFQLIKTFKTNYWKQPILI